MKPLLIKSKILRFFPKNKTKWKEYTLTTIPVIMAALIFSLNGVVDNFMSVSIEGGVVALTYANTWTNIVMGIISMTTIIGSALFGQYFGSNDKQNIRFVLRARMLFAIIISVLFAIPALIAPGQMIDISSGFNSDPSVRYEALLYLRLISLTWIIGAWGFTSAMIMREAGNLNPALISSVVSLVSNIILNSIFIFWLKSPIWMLAVSTIISQTLLVLYNVLYVYFKNKILIINPLLIFNIDLKILKQFLKRIPSFLLLSVGAALINIRYIFWNMAYGPGSVGPVEYHLSAAAFLGIASALFNVFWSGFESISTNTTIFVARKLGKNQVQEGIENSNELVGFHLIMAIIFGSLLLMVSFIVPYMDFLAEGYRLELENLEQQTGKPIDIPSAVQYYLENLKLTIIPLSYNMVIWAWFITRERSIASGGRTNLVSSINVFLNILQITWLIILTLVIVLNLGIKIHFTTAYLLFFLFDFIKLFVYEIAFWKIRWARDITFESKKEI
ncbi:MAG: MATE family efflux transporter [Metamycoplasmataceae bacterium]